LPQVNIAAASASQVTAGERTYHVLTYHGGVTYQFLVVNAGHESENSPGSMFGGKKIILWLLLLLLLIILLLIIVRKLTRKKHATYRKE
jgi:glucan phosphoethanolaminetransferase (alkaline phosphatase superfamily)